jgi:PAS domain S-box-containing protein
MSETVLIIDDSLTVRMDLAEAFAGAGFRPLPCANAAEARIALARGAVEAIILDVVLPDADGVDLLKELRATTGPALPIVMLSTEAEVKDRIRGLQTGANEYVGKPYDLSYLVARVRELIGRQLGPADGAGTQRVLVIDDSATFRGELARTFLDAGYQVEAAVSGEDGLRQAALRRPSAIVVDGVLPGIDGATVIRRVRLDAALRDVPCLLLTAADDDGAELRALEAGADAFVSKREDLPVVLAKLRAMLRQVEGRPLNETASLEAPKKLLAIDDSSTFLQELASVLRTEGYDVILAQSGEEGLPLLAIQRVDCVLLDLVMPGLGGEETCRRIKGTPATRDIPLIMLTAQEDRQAMIRGLAAGADDFIPKSSDLTIIKARVRAQLRRKQFEDENRRIRDELSQKQLEATEARAARALAESRAAMVSELERRVQERTTELRESEESLARTLESIGDAVIATDVEGKVMRVNAVAGAMTGFSPDEMRGRPLGELCRLIDEQTGAPAEDPIAEALRTPAGEAAVASHNLLVARGGRTHPVAQTGAPIRDAQGQVRGVVLVLRDLTEERRMQHLRAEARELQAENRHILEASRMKGEFLANMSHELRTPLNAIIGFAELLHSGEVNPETPEHREFLGYILDSGRHLLQLINDVLDLSKVEAGKFQFFPELIDLRVLVEEVLAILRTIVAGKRITIRREIDAAVTGIVLDGSRCKQVLYNYLSNALKFTPEGGEVTVRVLPEGDEHFRLEVEDTGVGIAAEDINRLFVEFQQLEAGVAKRHAGTGLGLALTKRLVEAQGGWVGVRSTPGKGSIFHAVFPRRPLPGAELPPAPRQLLPPAPEGAPVVLVVEDDPRDRDVLIETLAGAGYAADTAATGAEGLEKCRANRYAAVTLDLLLPDINGTEVLRRIRNEGRNRDVPVVVVTVVADKGAVAGFAVHDLLPKPLDGGALLASLKRTGVLSDGSGAVLVVDDDPAALKLMRLALQQLGCRVICEERGEAGLRAAAAAPPLALVLDLSMPEMDGFAFLHQFRQLPGCRAVPVVIWTVKDLNQEEMARLRASARAIITKGERPSGDVVEELRAFVTPGGNEAR